MIFLSDAERAQLKTQHLQSHTYLYVKDIIAYVQSTWSVTYTVTGMHNWLQRHDFSYKKPALVPGKANEQQQREWLAEYEKLKQNFRSRVRDKFSPVNRPNGGFV